MTTFLGYFILALIVSVCVFIAVGVPFLLATWFDDEKWLLTVFVTLPFSLAIILTLFAPTLT